MNARLYDPVVGRFLSPDPYVQAPFMSQNFNRYSYALNNPLRYTDPNGEFWQFIVAAVIGAGINVITHWDSINDGGFNWGKFGAYAGLGAASGALAATGNIFAITGSGALMAGGNSALNQGFENGFNNINWNQVGNSAILGGGLALVTVGGYKAIQPLASKLFASVGSPVLQQGLTQGTTAGTVGFTTGTGIGLIEGQGWEASLRMGVKSGLWSFGTGVTSGAYSGYKYAKTNYISPWTGKPLQNERALLYRNFGWNEYNSFVENNGKFSIQEDGFQGKQFWIGKEGLNMWENSNFVKPISVELSIPKAYVTPSSPYYIFQEPIPIIDLYPAGTVLPSNMNQFNSAINIIEYRYVY